MLLRRVPIGLVVAQLLAVVIALFLLLSRTGGVSTVGEVAVRNDYLVRLGLLGALSLVAVRVARRHDWTTVSILWALAAAGFLIGQIPSPF